jgi:hypothetical protein
MNARFAGALACELPDAPHVEIGETMSAVLVYAIAEKLSGGDRVFGQAQLMPDHLQAASRVYIGFHGRPAVGEKVREQVQ